MSHQVIAVPLWSARLIQGQHARSLRIVLDLSQTDFAKLLGVDRATVIRSEKARKKPLSLMADIAIRETCAVHSRGNLIVGVIGIAAGTRRCLRRKPQGQISN